MNRTQRDVFLTYVLLLNGLLTCATAQAQTVRSRVGISIPWPLTQSDSAIAADVNLCKSLGVSYIRTDLWWDTVETVKGQYDWSRFDSRFNTIKGAGLKVLAMLDYNNPVYATPAAWTSGFTTQANITGYKNFAVAAVKRYSSPSVSFELYNEPNQNDFWAVPKNGQPSKPLQYMNLVKATIPAIKAAVPKAVVIAPGLGHLNPGSVNSAPWQKERLDFSYLKSCLDLGLSNYANTISVHPYPDQSQQPENTLEATYVALGNLITKYPLPNGYYIYNSESGYTTTPDPNGITEAQQSQWMPRHILLDIYAQTISTTLFTLRDNPGFTGGSYGLIRKDGTKKPAFGSIQTLLQNIGDLSFTRRLDSANDEYLMEFTGGGKTVVAGWTTRGDQHNVTVSGKTVTLTGNVTYVQTSP